MSRSVQCCTSNLTRSGPLTDSAVTDSGSAKAAVSPSNGVSMSSTVSLGSARGTTSSLPNATSGGRALRPTWTLLSDGFTQLHQHCRRQCATATRPSMCLVPTKALRRGRTLRHAMLTVPRGVNHGMLCSAGCKSGPPNG